MSLTKMNVVDIMSEAVRTSVPNTDNMTVDEIAYDIANTVESIEEMTVDLKFTPEMVPVVFDESNQCYYVEYDMLKKLHESSDETELELSTKYGKIKVGFEPKTDEAALPEPDLDQEPITEEEPETSDDNEDTIDESFHSSYMVAPCWEKDALNAVILANMPSDPNKCEEDGMPEMTMENTYILIESQEDFIRDIIEIAEAAKSGGVALKNGKAKLKKADQVFKNLKNNGLKVAKKKSKKKKKTNKKK